jgi:hypothetical protein
MQPGSKIRKYWLPNDKKCQDFLQKGRRRSGEKEMKSFREKTRNFSPGNPGSEGRWVGHLPKA